MGHRTPTTNHEHPPGPPPWEDLKDWFIRLMLLPDGDWRHIWHLLLSHPWFKRELNRICSLCLWKRAEAVVTVEDLCQEVIKLLGEKLSRNPSLNLKIELADQQFGPWMSTVLRRLCRQARRRLSKPARTLDVLLRRRFTRDLGTLDHLTLELDPALREAIEKLSYGRRAVILLRALGNSYTAIAQVLHSSVAEVKLAEREGHRELRRRLGRDA